MDFILEHKWIIITSVVLIPVVIFLGLSMYIYLNAERLTFDNEKFRNIDYGDLQYTTEFIQNKTGDNIEIMKAENPSTDKVILYFHGNSDRLPYILKDASKVGTVISPAYPGWDKSTGSPSSDKIYETVDLTMKYLKDKNYDLSKVTVLGHSLGGSPAIYAGSKYPELHKVVVVNTFYSMQAMCETKYGALCFLGGNFLNSAKYAPDVKVKYRQFNNVNDDLIPYEQAGRLFQKVGSSDKRYFDIEGKHGVFDVIKVLETE